MLEFKSFSKCGNWVFCHKTLNRFQIDKKVILLVLLLPWIRQETRNIQRIPYIFQFEMLTTIVNIDSIKSAASEMMYISNREPSFSADDRCTSLKSPQWHPVIFIGHSINVSWHDFELISFYRNMFLANQSSICCRNLRRRDWYNLLFFNYRWKAIHKLPQRQ